MSRPRFTLAAIRRFHTATGINLMGKIDPAIWEDSQKIQDMLTACDPEKSLEWAETLTVPEILRAFVEDTRGGGKAAAADNKSPSPESGV